MPEPALAGVPQKAACLEDRPLFFVWETQRQPLLMGNDDTDLRSSENRQFKLAQLLLSTDVNTPKSSFLTPRFVAESFVCAGGQV
jgi:hypothetical protein